MRHAALVIPILSIALSCTGDPEDPSDSATTAPTADTGAEIEATFTVAVDVPVVRLPRDGRVRLPVTIGREGGYTGAVTVDVDGLPLNVTATPLSIDGGATMGELELAASSMAQLGGPAEVTVRGTPDAGDPVSVTVPLYVAGPPGSLDPSFSFDGTFTFVVDAASDDEVSDAVAVDDQGRVMVGGETSGKERRVFLLRLLADGTLDATFGSGGLVREFEEGSSLDDLVLRPDGSPVVLVRESDNARTLSAFDDAGALDAGFGAGGRYDLGPTSGSVWPGLALRPTGGILVGKPDGLLALDAAGAVDPSFTDAKGAFGNLSSIAYDLDGRLLVGGYETGEFIVERRFADGTVDEGFGDAGDVFRVDSAFGLTAFVTGLAPTADGGAVGLGSEFDPTTAHPVLFRFDASGALDNSFGTGGTVPLFTGSAVFRSVAIQADGNVVTVGYGGEVDLTYEIRRFNPDGSPDVTFGEGGTVNPPGVPLAVALEPEAGRMVVASIVIGEPGVRIARYWQ